MAKKKLLLDLDWGNYFVQLSLIILSILIALGVDRCVQNSRNQDRLEKYLVVMEQELEYEAFSTDNNMVDAQKDVDNLRSGIALLSQGVDTATEQALRLVITTFVRGVFRDFPPMAYERMAAANDAFLITDLELREALQSVASFRTDYVQYDLKKYDNMVLEIVDRYSRYLDINCILQNKLADPLNCVNDPVKLNRFGAADLSRLQYMAQIRLFHLDLYAQSIAAARQALAAYLGEPVAADQETK